MSTTVRGGVYCVILERPVSTTVEGRSIWCYLGETCEYHSRLEEYVASLSGGRPVSTVEIITCNILIFLKTFTHTLQCYQFPLASKHTINILSF